MDDKRTELLRYENRAKNLLKENSSVGNAEFLAGANAVPLYYRAPYLCYEELIRRHTKRQDKILEICAGTGLHTSVLVQTGAQVTASDISSSSLGLIKKKFGNGVTTAVADMEELPFPSASFEVVACAGGLSYGEPELVDAEIKRVLKNGGAFISVDSLNHNPIYRLNRYLHYLRGNRTMSTLTRMPTLDRIEALASGFTTTDVHFFGATSYLMPLVAVVVGDEGAAKLSNALDRLINVRCSAFKFVMAAQKKH